MRITADLSLRQSLSLNTDMRLAIDMLAMSHSEIIDLIEEELKKNPSIDCFEPLGPKAEALMEQIAYEPDFRQDLLEQLALQKLSYFEQQIARFLVHSLDDHGLLPDKEEVYQLIIDEFGVFAEWIDVVRCKIMNLSPMGCGAKDTKESLFFLLKQCKHSHEDFLYLINNPPSKLNLAHALSKADPHFKELKTLKLKPNDCFSSEAINIDILVERAGDKLWPSLLKKPSQLLGISPSVPKKEKRAHFILRALKFRESSLLKLATFILIYQKDWFLGRGALRPLCLNTAAQALDLHESSISRLSRNKYLACAQGTFELKYFFSSKALVNEYGECSSLAVKEKIRALINQENKKKPLSDQQIAHILIAQSMPIARRTVAKYRESLKLLKAQDRRIE
jgi:RNA polymerase sigma-54 factor